MIGKIKKYVTIALAATFLAVPVLVPAAVSAADDTQIQGPLCNGAVDLEFDTTAGTCDNVDDADNNVSNLIKQVINILSVIVGVIAVIMIIWGGLKYITSGGESSNITSAKNTIIFAIVGLIIVALAQFIVRFVLNRALTASTDPA